MGTKDWTKEYVLSKLQHAKSGLTVKELLYEDAHLSGYSPEMLHRLLGTLEIARKVTADVVVGRGEVYRIL
jgi:hypothetical protein